MSDICTILDFLLALLDQYEEFEVGDDVPTTADFGIRVSGDSMEPIYVNKQIAWVHQQDQLENGDIGIFGKVVK